MTNQQQTATNAREHAAKMAETGTHGLASGDNRPDVAPLDEGLARLLGDLSTVQSDLLGVLRTKTDLLVARDVAGLQGLQSVEAELIERLRDLQTRREELLEQAHSQGLLGDSLHEVACRMPDPPRRRLKSAVQAARSQSRLLQHQSLANWVLAQRSLIHLSQLLEIVATGGRPRPTYGDKQPLRASGALMDQAV